MEHLTKRLMSFYKMNHFFVFVMSVTKLCKPLLDVRVSVHVHQAMEWDIITLFIFSLNSLS